MRLLFWWFAGIAVKGNGYETIVFCIVDDAGIIHTGADGEQGIKICQVLGKSDPTPLLAKMMLELMAETTKPFTDTAMLLSGGTLLPWMLPLKFTPMFGFQ